MTVRAIGLGLVLLLAVGCGGHGATQFSGTAPTAEATFGSCAFCHQSLASYMTDTGGHRNLDVKCEFCHEDLTPGQVGPGHRAIPACTDCHTRQMTHHDPAAGTSDACHVCHTPHGSHNIYLIKEQIQIPSGDTRDIDFTNLMGLADGSFASATQPGTGLCEVCHTTTMFYRSDGSGETHFPYACFTCHPHAEGFEPTR